MKVSQHPLYHTWNGMVRRCKDPKNINYSDYGARGIKIFEEWSERGFHGTTKTPPGFIKFLKYIDENLGKRPEGYSIDRIDNNSGYIPGNIRWADNSTQNINRRCPNGSLRNIRKVPSGKYQVNMWYNKKQYYVGTYTTVEEAIISRDNYRKKLQEAT